MILIFLLLSLGAGYVIYRFNDQAAYVVLFNWHVEGQMWEMLGGAFLAGVLFWLILSGLVRLAILRRRRRADLTESTEEASA